MPQKSSIETQLSEEQLDILTKKIGTGKWSVDGLKDLLGEWGYEISRSATHRHIQKVEDKLKEDADALRESRMIVEALGKELGDSETLGEQGRLLVEMARNLTFDLIRKVRQENRTLDPKDIAMLGKGLAEMGRALRLDQDFETNIRKQIEREIKEQAADAVDAAVAGEKGLSAETAEMIKNKILGTA